MPKEDTQFKPGIGGHHVKHPGGYMACRLKKMLSSKGHNIIDPATGKMTDVDGYDAVAKATIDQAAAGNMKAAEIIYERVDGKSVQKIEAAFNVNKMNDITIEGQPMELQIGSDKNDAPGNAADAGEDAPNNT